MGWENVIVTTSDGTLKQVKDLTLEEYGQLFTQMKESDIFTNDFSKYRGTQKPFKELFDVPPTGYFRVDEPIESLELFNEDDKDPSLLTKEELVEEVLRLRELLSDS